MEYIFAPDLQEKAIDICRKLFPHVRIERVRCFRSKGSKAIRVIARCHALGKLMQQAIGINAVYALEFLSEQFERLNEREQTKVIIHELMHIPKTFGGGFKHHNFVTDKNVNLHYKKYCELVENEKKDKFKI